MSRFLSLMLPALLLAALDSNVSRATSIAPRVVASVKAPTFAPTSDTLRGCALHLDFSPPSTGMAEVREGLSGNGAVLARVPLDGLGCFYIPGLPHGPCTLSVVVPDRISGTVPLLLPQEAMNRNYYLTLFERYRQPLQETRAPLARITELPRTSVPTSSPLDAIQAAVALSRAATSFTPRTRCLVGRRAWTNDAEDSAPGPSTEERELSLFTPTRDVSRVLLATENARSALRLNPKGEVRAEELLAALQPHASKRDAAPRPALEHEVMSCPWASGNLLLVMRVLDAPLDLDGASLALDLDPGRVDAWRIVGDGRLVRSASHPSTLVGVVELELPLASVPRELGSLALEIAPGDESFEPRILHVRSPDASVKPSAGGLFTAAVAAASLVLDYSTGGCDADWTLVRELASPELELSPDGDAARLVALAASAEGPVPSKAESHGAAATLVRAPAEPAR